MTPKLCKEWDRTKVRYELNKEAWRRKSEWKISLDIPPNFATNNIYTDFVVCVKHELWKVLFKMSTKKCACKIVLTTKPMKEEIMKWQHI